MSNYVGRFFTAVSSALEFNSATLSGAIDIIVIEDEDGRRRCSPFYVRFGKLQLLRSRGIPVNVKINGKQTDLRLRLGTAGEAYFKTPVEDIPFSSADHLTESRDHHQEASTRSTSAAFSRTDEQDLENDSTRSPDGEFSTEVPEKHDVSTSSPRTHLPLDYMSDSEVEVSRTARDGRTEVIERPRSPPAFPEERRWNVPVFRTRSYSLQQRPKEQGKAIEPTRKRNHVDIQENLKSSLVMAEEHRDKEKHLKKLDSHDVQDTDKKGIVKNPRDLEPSEKRDEDDNELSDVSSKFMNGLDKELGFDEPKRTDIAKDEEVTGAENSSQAVLSNILSRALEISRKENSQELNDGYRDNDSLTHVDEGDARRNGHGESISSSSAGSLSEQRTSTSDTDETDARLLSPKRSLTVDGDRILAMSLCADKLSPGLSEEQICSIFEAQRVTQEQFAEDPNLLYNSNMLFRIEERLVDFRVAVPFILSRLAYGVPLDIDFLSKHMKQPFENSRAKQEEASPPPRRFTWFGFRSPVAPKVKGTPLLGDDDLKIIDQAILNKSENEKVSSSNEPPSDRVIETEVATRNFSESSSEGVVAADEPKVKVAEESVPEIPIYSDYTFGDVDNDYLSLKPSNELLERLDLNPGLNEIRFQVACSSVEVISNIYLWRSDTKIVVSDVDGTITRSDVLGHILPRVGRDWSHAGVAGLYTHIARNGYKFMYLTSRPIGQADSTRAFLDSVSQPGGFRLPKGPIIMSPDRLVESFTREVIRRKPHEFKIAALREIRSLFRADYNAFHSGFGNRDTDVTSYKACGIPPYRIFTVNPQGELVVMKALYESAGSYTSLRRLVESVFPDISGKHGEETLRNLTEASKFNDWNFWKPEVRDVADEIDLDSLL